MFKWVKSRVTGPLIVAAGKVKERNRFAAPPVLIGGAPRSGTTLLLAILAAHPHIWAISDETNIFRTWSAGRRPLNIYRLYKRILWERIPEPARRWCEKTPCHVRFIPQIMDYLDGRLRFIHIVRDARDVTTSFLPAEPDRFFVSPGQWMQDVSAGLSFRDHPAVLTIRYEDLVFQEAVELNRICKFLDEPFTSELASWHENSPKRKDKAWRSGLSKMHTKGIGRWKDPAFAERVEEVMRYPGLSDMLRSMGYEV
jgi:hypothetical protein